MEQNLKYLGFGLGLRPTHYETIVDTRPEVDWFELVTEDFLVDGGQPLYYLDKIREHYPLVMHGVSLSIGSTDPLNRAYLNRLKQLIARVQPRWVSDHFCWTGIGGENLHGLLPVPYTKEAVEHIAERVIQVQDFLGRQILLENVSSYVDYTVSEMTEWEFITEIANKSDCLLLLDINNVYVNAFNHGFSAEDFIDGVPVNRVQQFHMAGHDNCKTHIVDTHDAPIIDSVWSLYKTAVKRFGTVSTLIERDDNIPNMDEMLEELNRSRLIFDGVKAGRLS